MTCAQMLRKKDWQSDGSGDSNTPQTFIYGGKIKRPDNAKSKKGIS